MVYHEIIKERHFFEQTNLWSDFAAEDLVFQTEADRKEHSAFYESHTNPNIHPKERGKLHE